MKTHSQSNKAANSAVQAKAKNQANKGSILQAYKKGTAQLASMEEEELLQGKFETAQLEELAEEDEEPAHLKENKTGLPNNLKSGVENISGQSLDDVKVHYNSSQPAALQAHAYAQGTDIHVAPGQEKHLPHEAWHVVQQKEGRVQPTKQLKGTTNINDDAGLEKEADVMGAKALNLSDDTTNSVQLKSVGANTPIQFALPGSYAESNADDYNPHGKSDTYRDGVKNFERLATSGFATDWRETMILHWQSKGWVHKNDWQDFRWIKENKEGKWVHEGGIQLDHLVPVATMKDDLRSVNEDTAINTVYADPVMKNYYHLEDGDYDHLSWPKNKALANKKNSAGGVSVEPTIHAARKYYHDMDNLVPLLGSDNAAKGDDDDTELNEWDDDFLESQKTWLGMTDQVHYGVEEKNIDEVQDAVTKMQNELDSYDDSWPI